MCAHDAVAQKDFYPHLPDIPVEVDEDEETIKIVQLVKSNEPLVSFSIFRIKSSKDFHLKHYVLLRVTCLKTQFPISDSEAFNFNISRLLLS